MSIGLLYWILMLLWLTLGIFRSWPGAPADVRLSWGGDVLLFVLLLLLGWAAFGAAVHR